MKDSITNAALEDDAARVEELYRERVAAEHTAHDAQALMKTLDDAIEEIILAFAHDEQGRQRAVLRVYAKYAEAGDWRRALFIAAQGERWLINGNGACGMAANVARMVLNAKAAEKGEEEEA